MSDNWKALEGLLSIRNAPNFELGKLPDRSDLLAPLRKDTQIKLGNV